MKLVSVLICFQFLFLSCSQKSEGIKPIYRDITEAVYSTVVVEPQDLYEVFPSVSGLIDFAYVKIGDTVQNNTLLLKIRNPMTAIETENAQLRYQITQEAYSGKSNVFNELDKSINSAKMKMKNDSINYKKQSKLWNLNIGSEQEYEARKLAYDVSRNEYDRMINDYDRKKQEYLKNTRVANNTYKGNQINTKEFEIRSRIEGVIYDIYKEIGESVSPQTPIALLGSMDKYILKLLIDEIDITKVFIGQKAVISLDAVPDKTYEARVSKIFPTKDLRSQTFTVEAEFITKPYILYNGLSGEANIILSERKKVLTVPTEFITVDDKLKLKNGYIEIKKGVKSILYTEIIGDIDTNTVIYKLQ